MTYSLLGSGGGRSWDGLPVNFDPIETGAAAGSVTGAAHQVGEADFLDPAQVRIIHPVTVRGLDNIINVEIAPARATYTFAVLVDGILIGAFAFKLAPSQTAYDDPSSLYLSTDENPANKHLIAVESSWSNARNWNTPGGGTSMAEEKRSDLYAGSTWPTGNTINLTAGRRYYIEVLHTEGGGGDNVGVAWQLPGGVAPADGEPPIPGSAISSYYNPDGTMKRVIQTTEGTDLPPVK